MSKLKIIWQILTGKTLIILSLSEHNQRNIISRIPTDYPIYGVNISEGCLEEIASRLKLKKNA